MSTEFSARNTLKVVVIVFGVLIALRFLWIAHAIFIVSLLGVLAGLALEKPVDWLERHRVRRGIGAPVSLLFFLGLLVALGAAIAPSIREQSKQLAQELPKALEKFEEKIGASGIIPQMQPQGGQQDSAQQQPRGGAQAGTQQGETATQQQGSPAGPGGEQGGAAAQQQPPTPEASPQQGGIGAQLAKEIRGLTRFLFPVISSVFGAIAGFIVILFIALYIAIDPGLYRNGLVHLVPHGARKRTGEVLDELRGALRQWLIARLLAMIAIGTITGVGLTLMRVDGAIALGVLAGLLEMIPFFGPFASAVPAIGVALVDSPQKAIGVALLYLVVQQLEGNLITPLILEQRLEVPPVLTVVAVAAMGVVFGVLGMLIAEPLLVAGLVVTKMLYVEDVVGDETGRS